MFRKVQLKFFGIIIAILIAIFIGVLSSINIIMDLMMERQTKVVLQQVANGVEYDEKSLSFSFTNPNKNKEPPKNVPKPPVTKQPVDTAPPTEKSTKTVPTTQKPAETAPPAAQTNVPVVQTTAVSTKQPEIPQTEPPQSRPNEEIKTEPVKPTEPPQETQPPFEWGGGQPPAYPPNPWDNPWYNPWENPWYEWGDWDDKNEHHNNNDNDNKNENNPPNDGNQNGNGGIKPAVNDNFMPVLDGYTVITVNGNENQPPEPPPDDNMPKDIEPVPRSLGSIEFFVIMADKDGKYAASANNDSLTAETAQEYIDQIIADNETIGMTGNMSYCAEKKSNGTLMVLTDRTAEIDMMRKLKRTTLIVGIISIIFLSAAAYFLSGFIVSPLKETFEKQKQFISDASHELKTPLTVISTNADVLEGEIGENKWLNYIQDQADRMNVLVNDLLSLSRLENNKRDFITGVFNLSRAVTNAALPFECQAFESQKNFILNIEEDIYLNGSEQHIKQMTGIFIDNALKYSKDGGTVRVSLTKEDNKAVLAVYNTGSGVPEEDVDKLFERFYRSDESRTRSTGGYGLGLAIAKSIIDKHKFKVQVENQEGKSICFVVTM